MNTDMNDNLDLQDLLNEPVIDAPAIQDPAPAAAEPTALSPFLHRIPVTLTLEAGAAHITLQELSALTPDSVVALDTPVGEPLIIKVNGTAIGKGEVVVLGDAYGLKVVELQTQLPALMG